MSESAYTAQISSVIESRIYVFIGDTPDGTLFLFSIRRMAYVYLRCNLQLEGARERYSQ